MRPVRSMEYFFHKLRSFEMMKVDVFKELFASYREYLAAGLGYYRPKRIRPMKKEDLMKELDIDEALANFVVEISETLDLDLIQSYDIFCGYLLYDYAGPTRDMKMLTTDAANKKLLVVDVQSYFHREQLSLLLSTVEILKLIQRPRGQLPHVATLENFIFDKLATPSFVDSLLTSLKGIWERQIEESASAVGSALNGTVLARHCFALQEQLIRVLIWLFYVSDLPANCDAGVLKFFVEQNFGRKQFYKKLLPTYESNDFINRIFNLEILFTMKSFHLESLLVAYSDATREKDTYWLNEKQAKEASSILDAYISPTSHDHASVALAYTLNLQLRHLISLRDKTSSSNDSMDLEADIQKYGCIAKRNDCLKFCNRFLASSAISDDVDTKSLARAVVYVALDGCLQFFEADSIGPAEDFTTLFSDILRDSNVAEAFWSKCFSNGASSYVLNEIVYHFYASFRRPLRVLCALAAASLESCQKVVKLCQKLPVFSEPIELVEPSDLALVDDVEDMQDENAGPSFVLVKARQPFEVDGPVLPVGTRGRIIKSPVGAEEFVQWEFSYNAWQLCLLEITKDKPNPARIAAVLDLIGQILKTDPSSVTLFVHFLTEVIAMLKRARYFFDAELLISTLKPCFKCLAAAAKTFPYEILAQIGDDDILPSPKPLSQADFRLSLTSRILNDVERLSGLYDCTISFLQLVECCCDEVSCYELPGFAGSVSYVCDSIFSDCLSWPYENAGQRNEIATACLQICRKILEKWTAANEENRVALKEIVGICRRALTQGEARRSLLRLASVGVDALKDSYGAAENGRVQDHVAETVSLALALLLELMIDFENMRTDTSTPQIFVDLFFSTTSSMNVGAEPPLCAIGRYLLLRTNDRIPKLAIICLKRIAKLFPATVLSTFSEWTSAFCDAFLTRLESPMEDVQLKVYCIEFLIAAVQHQPGLAEQLLGVSATSEDNGSTSSTAEDRPKTTGDSGALDCVLALMKSDRLLPDLAIACVNLLATIWCTNCTTAMNYLREKKKEEFWPTLLAPLSSGEDSYFLTIVSPILRILTREVFASSTSSFVSKLKSLNGAGDGKSSGRAAIVTTVVQEIMEAERLRLTFKKLREYCESRIDFKEKTDVLGAWRDFLQVVFVVKTTNGGLADNSKWEILTGSINILKVSLNTFEQPGGVNIVKAASELCSLALKYCLRIDAGQESIVKEFESVFDRLNDGHLDEWSLQLSVIVLPVCCAVFRLPKLNKKDTETLPTIFDTSCSILVKNLIQTATLRTKNLLGSTMFPWLKALQSSLRCLALLYSYVSTIGEKKLLDILQKHSVLRNLRVLMAALLDAGYLDTSLLSSVCLLVESAARSAESFSIISSSGFLEWICVDLVRAHKTIACDVDLLSALFAVHISILEAGAHNAVPVCATFLASYSDVAVQILRSLSISPSAKTAKAVSRALQLLILLAGYKDRWQFETLESQELMIDAVRLLCYRLPPYLAKPAALAEALSKGERGTALDGVVTISSTDPKVAFMQHLLIEILFSGIQFLLRFSPDLMDACNNPSFDARSFRPLLALDLNTNLSPDVPVATSEEVAAGAGFVSTLTFGAVLLIVHLCVNSLRKVEAVKSASPSAHRASAPPLLTSAGDRGVITALLESALYFLLSQAALYIKLGCLSDTWQRTLLKRDLAAELLQYLTRCGVRTSGGSAPTTPRKSPTPTPVTSPGAGVRVTTAGFDYQFLKFVSDFVRDVLRNND